MIFAGGSVMPGRSYVW